MTKIAFSETPYSPAAARRIRMTGRVVIFGLVLLLLYWFVERYFVFSGQLVIRHSLTNPSPLVSHFASKEPYLLTASRSEEGKQERFFVITRDPMYFDLTVPRPFTRATVTLTYQNPQQQPIVNIGVQTKKGPYLKAAAAADPVLETLPPYWVRLREGSVVLWQRDKNLQRQYEDFVRRERERLNKEQLQELNKLKQRVRGGELTIQDEISQADDLRKHYDAAKKELVFTPPDAPDVPYGSVAEFFQDPPSPVVTGTYNYDLTVSAPPPGYQPATQPLVLGEVLRGKHEMVTYIAKDEELWFEFLVQSINRHAGRDSVSLEAWHGAQKVAEEKIPAVSEGNTDGRPSEEKTVRLQRSNVPQGVYRIVINAPDDIFFKRIATKQRLLMFKKRLYLADNPEYKAVLGERENRATNLLVQGSVFSAQTAHEAGFQSVRIGNRTLVVSELHKEKTIEGLQGTTKVISPENDLLLMSDGYFAFSQDQLFPVNWTPTSITRETNFEKLDFIIADYPAPVTSGEWLRATASFESPVLTFRDKKRVQFLVNVPGLSENYRQLLIRDVTITFEKDPLTFSRAVKSMRSLISSLF